MDNEELMKKELMKEELMKEELTLLRDELKALKDCQTRYIGLAVASVGAIFSYLFGNFGNFTQFNSIIQTDVRINSVYLIPLVIIIPISCIFFNKAVTVTRIVGYYQLLEDFNLGTNTKKYIGWENALRKYRECGRDNEKLIKKDKGKIQLWEDLSPIKKIEYFFRIFGFNMEPLHEIIITNSNAKNSTSNNKQDKTLSDFSKPPTYWELVYGTFFAMCALCFILSIGPVIVFCVRYLIHNIFQQITEYTYYSYLLNLIIKAVQINRFNLLLIWIFLAVSVYIFRYNLKTLYQLERGFYSYHAYYIFWKEILIEQPSNNVKEPENPFALDEEKETKEKEPLKKQTSNNDQELENTSASEGTKKESFKKKSARLKEILKKIPKPQIRMIFFSILYLLGIIIIIFI